MRDPINAELHRYRKEHARKFNFDLAAICKDLREQFRHPKTVRLPPKRIRRQDEDNARENP